LFTCLWTLAGQAMFSPHVDQARWAYASFVRDGMGEGRRGEFHGGTFEGRILGDDAFADEVLSKVSQREEREYSLEEVIAAVCAHYQISPEKLKVPGKVRPMTEARAVAAAIVQQSPHLRMTDLAKALDRDISALGKAAQRAAGEETICGILKDLAGRLRTSRIRNSSLTPIAPRRKKRVGAFWDG
jgi:putative transposase